MEIPPKMKSVPSFLEQTLYPTTSGEFWY